MTANREAEIVAAFIGVADRLVDDYDVVDVTTQLAQDCARLMDVAAVGLLLADASGVLHLLAATSEEARKVEAFQLQRDEGPCLDCYHSGVQVSVADLAEVTDRWPRFTASAIAEGFASLHAIPIRLRDVRLGAMGLFGARPGELRQEDVRLALGLAQVAAIAIAQNTRALDRGAVLGSLQSAVSSRGMVDMAKGVISEAVGIDMAEAFGRLRGYAHQHHQRLTDVARDVVLRTLPADQLGDGGPSGPPTAS